MIKSKGTIKGKIGTGVLYIVAVVEELPEPTEEYRGHFRIVETDGVDKVYVCLKNAGVFEWVDLSNRETEMHECTYGEWTYNAETGKDERTCSECGYVETTTHDHNYQAGATEATKNPNDVCTKVPYTCTTCGDVYYDDEVEHAWEEDWLDPNLETCTVCGIFREKSTE